MKKTLTEIVIPKNGRGIKLKVKKRLTKIDARNVEKLKAKLEAEGLKVTVV